MPSQPLVGAAWLAAHLDDPWVRIVDVRWYLDPTRRGRAAYDAGHIRGALFMDLDSALSGPGGRRGGPLGRHPWPEPHQVEKAMGDAGIDAGTFVVAYDDQAGAVAARLWYVLRAHGHEAVALLDGGLAKWLAEGRELSTAWPAVEPRSFVAQPVPRALVTKQEMIDRPAGGLLIDARAGERFRGEVEPVDPRAGHIPGAVSLPYASNLTDEAVPIFRSPEELRRLYAGLGADREEPIAYCGSGVTSCHTLVALAVAGLHGRLYAGSWSEWSADPAMPVATGA